MAKEYPNLMKTMNPQIKVQVQSEYRKASNARHGQILIITKKEKNLEPLHSVLIKIYWKHLNVDWLCRIFTRSVCLPENNKRAWGVKQEWSDQRIRSEALKLKRWEQTSDKELLTSNCPASGGVCLAHTIIYINEVFNAFIFYLWVPRP